MNKAKEIGGISGWVHNAANGSVEILMRGDEKNIDAMLLACNKGPSLARVDKITFKIGRISSFLPPIEDGIFKRA